MSSVHQQRFVLIKYAQDVIKFPLKLKLMLETQSGSDMQSCDWTIFRHQLCFVSLLGSGCFHPCTHVSGDEDGLLPGKPLHAQQSETGQRDSRGIGRHVWTDARYELLLLADMTWTYF